MNIVNKVTLRHIKQNKRQSLVTVIGIIISVAMITAVFTLGFSYLDLMIRKEIKQNGEWHVQYSNVTSEQIQAIKQDRNTKKLALSNNSYARFEQSTNESKPYLYFQNFNAVGMEQFPIELKKGRLPQSENEVIISEDILRKSEGHLNIGSKISIDLGERWPMDGERVLTQSDALMWSEQGVNETLKIHSTKTVTIVGLMKRPSWEPAWSPGYTVIGYVDETVVNKANIDAIVIAKDINGDLFQKTKSFAKKNGIKDIGFNNELLRYYGITNNANLQSTLFSLAAIIIGIIMIGSVALIYNAFAISVSERAKHLGMLSSIGATKRQKRNSVFFEGLVIGAVSIPIGVLVGIIGMKITFVFINTFIDGALGITEKLELVVTPTSLLIACGLSALTIFISVYIPAQKASKISAIDAIRQTQDIKLTSKTVKTSKLIRKLFGIEAEIGLKNVKRYKKRYLATVFSLVISIVLFLSISYFTDNLKKSILLSQNNYNFDIQIYSSQSGKEPLNGFTGLDYITKSAFIEEVSLNAKIEKERLPTPLMEQIQKGENSLDDNGKYPYYVQVYALDEQSFKDYIQQIHVNESTFLQTNEPTAIVIEKIAYEEAGSGKIIETNAIETEIGEKIDLVAYSYGENDQPKEQLINSVKIGALTNELPMGVQSAELGGLSIIISEGTLKQLEIPQEFISHYLYLNSSNPLATQEAIEQIKESNIYVFNVYQERQRQQQMVLLMSVFSYGFISLIALISIANIFNTISTSVQLRKREFAMLRSVGLTPKGFNKMIRYESIFYGIKALIYGLPISILLILFMHNSFQHTFVYEFEIPWRSVLIVVIFISLIVGLAMIFSISKIKKQNIIEGLKQENI